VKTSEFFDGRMVANRACDEAANYKSFYGGSIPGRVLCERLASYMHLFNLYWSMRCAVLL
jgi:20S proteasome subunit alpha 7